MLRLRNLVFVAVVLYFAVSSIVASRTCHENEIRYLLTDCDQTHGRWRVKVPKTDDCELAKPENPQRVTSCNTVCSPGNYYDIEGDLKCHKCIAGHYSMGAVEEYTSWSHIPSVFSVTAAVSNTEQDNFYDTLNMSSTQDQCGGKPWRESDKWLELRSNSKKCVVILSYAANLIRKGYFEITYQHPDGLNNIVTLQIENNACERSRDRERSSELNATRPSEWRSIKVPLKTGTSVISLWVESSPTSDSDIAPVLIKNITVSGMAYTSRCKACPKGFFAEENGSPRCSPCQHDTFSAIVGATHCTNCKPDEYADPGSEKCLPKKPCTSTDYYSKMSPCDQYGKAKISYYWFKPFRCSVSEGQHLPHEQTISCPDCNPGQFKNTTINPESKNEIRICSFCPPGHYSDGTFTKCKPCSESSFSVSGIFLQRWRLPFPPDVIDNVCDNTYDLSCSSEFGWVGEGDFLKSVSRNGPAAYNILTVRVDRVHQPVTLSLDFETNCEDECLFIVATTPTDDDSDSGNYDLIYRSTKSIEKEAKTFKIMTEPPYSLLILFRKLTTARFRELLAKTIGNGSFEMPTGKFDYNHAKIYQLNLTNVEPGGMSECYDCAQLNPQPPFCRTCQAGSYRFNESTCTSCPTDHITPPVKRETSPGTLTYVGEHSDKCVACPANMRASGNGLSCYSDCKFNFTSSDSTNFHWDMSNLGVGMAKSLPILTPSGTKYFTTFNISLCGEGEPPKCRRGKAAFSIEMLSSRINDGSQSNELRVGKSQICSAMVLQPKNEIYTSRLIGSRLSAITFSLGNIAKSLLDAKVEFHNKTVPSIFNSSNLPDSSYSMIPDVLYVFRGDGKSASCPNGPLTVVIARCDPRSVNGSSFSLPSSCPVGSCDSCNYLVLWNSNAACPKCDDKENDYYTVEGGCSFGSQPVWRYPKQHCLLLGKEREKIRTQSCNPLPLPIQIMLIAVGTLVLILGAVLLVTCKRTKKLEYRYMKLVESTGHDEEDELPQAESCAVEVDAPDDGDVENEAATSSGSRKMERMKIAGASKKTRKFRTMEDAGYRGTGATSAFFESLDSSGESLMQSTRPSVL